MSVERARDAYTARAAEYIELFGAIDAAAAGDRDLVLGWARRVDGRILDVGCGPGQWTGFLAGHGLDVEGIDPVPAFVAEARHRHPGLVFRVGRAEQLEVPDASLGGALAWYSLIHTDPDEIGGPMRELARAIRPGGALAVGFFEGPVLEPFDHAVTTAYRWPVSQLAGCIERAGFVVTETAARTDPGARRQGAILARRGA